MSYTELKRAVYEANMELYKRGLVLYTFGNVSQIDRAAAVMAIKPSGVAYEDMRPDDMVIVDLDNHVVEGRLRPSSDTKTHSHLYRSFSQIGGVTHTHSTYATAWAQARQAIPCLGTTHADFVYGDISCTEQLSSEQVARDYEAETGVQIATRIQISGESFLTPPGDFSALVAAASTRFWMSVMRADVSVISGLSAASTAVSPLRSPWLKWSKGGAEAPAPCRRVVKATTPGGTGHCAGSSAGQKRAMTIIRIRISL